MSDITPYREEALGRPRVFPTVDGEIIEGQIVKSEPLKVVQLPEIPAPVVQHVTHVTHVYQQAPAPAPLPEKVEHQHHHHFYDNGIVQALIGLMVLIFVSIGGIVFIANVAGLVTQTQVERYR